MEDFGVRFVVRDRARFEALRALFAELKRDKDAESFRAPERWVPLVPDAVKARFSWPTDNARRAWLAVREHTPAWVALPAEQLSARWDFYRLFESIEECDYGLERCEMVDGRSAELRIDPHGYPYGGVGALMALVEAFGFELEGVNECGEYESRALLLAGGLQEEG